MSNGPRGTEICIATLYGTETNSRDAGSVPFFRTNEGSPQTAEFKVCTPCETDTSVGDKAVKVRTPHTNCDERPRPSIVRQLISDQVVTTCTARYPASLFSIVLTG